MSIKFVDDLPEGNPRGGERQHEGSVARLRSVLAQHPGQWAEERREPRDRVKNAHQRAQYLKRSGFDATTRMVGDECIVFARVVVQ